MARISLSTVCLCNSEEVSGELRGKPISTSHGCDEIDSSWAEQKEERKDGCRFPSGHLCGPDNCLFVLAVDNISASYREGFLLSSRSRNRTHPFLRKPELRSWQAGFTDRVPKHTVAHSIVTPLLLVSLIPFRS